LVHGDLIKIIECLRWSNSIKVVIKVVIKI
jgi:hypothetical protein